MVDDNVVEVSVVDYIDDLRRTKPGFFYDAERPASTSAYRNPWKRETFNITEQMRLERRDPALAARFEADAQGGIR